MRDFYLQTPHKDQTPATRRSKSLSDPAKKPHKVSKKSLNSALTAVSENESSIAESPKESIDCSSKSEEFLQIVHLELVSEELCFAVLQNSLASGSSVSIPSETVPLSDISPSLSTSSYVITCDMDIAANDCKAICENSGVNPLKQIGSVEAEMVIRHFIEARIQLKNSNDMDNLKKLVDVFLNIIINDLVASRYEEDWINKLASSNAHVAILNFLLGILAIFVFLLFNYGSKGLSIGPPPT